MLKNLLLIDDDEFTLKTLEFAANKHDFVENIRWISRGDLALQYFDLLVRNEEVTIPDLILLDLYMPRMNGWEFLEIFTDTYYSSFPDIKVCIVTNSVSTWETKKAAQYPQVITFIEKPFGFKNLHLLKEHENLSQHFESTHKTC